MFSRYFLMAVCAFALVAAAVGKAIEYPEVEEDLEEDSVVKCLPSFSDIIIQGLTMAIGVVGKTVNWAIASCAEDAAKYCKDHGDDGRALLDCAKDYMLTNKGTCLIGIGN